MTADQIPERLRTKPEFHHVDPGFINQRLCINALHPQARDWFLERKRPEDDHAARLANAHWLVTALLDSCESLGVPTLQGALRSGQPRHLFRSTERLAPCPNVYTDDRVSHAVLLDVDFGKPVNIAYHTSHLVSETGKMVLAKGPGDGHTNSIVGLLHDRSAAYEVEPFLIGAPWFEHPRNGDDGDTLVWHGYSFGEILPDDIDQFARMKHIHVDQAGDWMDALRELPEDEVKRAFVALFKEPPKKDWGGEQYDHYTANISIAGKPTTAAFMFKGPAGGRLFREMTLDMCGSRADQIHRMVDANADVSTVQHCHTIGHVVRRTLRSLTVYPGCSHRKYCLIDGLATYRILKAYSVL